MKKEELMEKAVGICHKAMFHLKKNSPQIFVIGGIVGTVAATVMACVATTKLPEILEEHQKKMDAVRKSSDEEGAKKETALVYAQTGIKIAGLYAPAAALELLSLSGIIASHVTMKKRNAGLTAAYATLDKAFKQYRKGVIEKFGDKVDRELRLGLKQTQIEEVEIDPETGKEKTVKKTVDVFDPEDPSTYSEYARFFDDGCLGWEKDPEYNLSFLRVQQNYANDKLRAQGYLYLNDVYDMLGIPKTKAGQVVGWIYDAENPVGDNYVDFGIYDIRRRAAREFVNGLERTILLDFNVDGNIWELMK